MAIVQQWKNDGFAKAGITADVLRLDLLHPAISGNKWLKLKGYLQKAKKANNVGIITKGGPWSNHVHACAYACRGFGLSCTLWIKGNEKQLTITVKDCMDWGADIRYINRTEFYDEAAAEHYAAQNNLLYIPLGGAGTTGIESVSEYICELGLNSYSHVLCAVGTGTTLAGLAFVSGNFKNIIGIESGTKDEQTELKIKEWQLQLPEKNIQLNYGFMFGGYAKYNVELIQFMNNLYEQTLIPTDIVYTSKLFYAAQAFINKSYFEEGNKILIIHSGGLQGNRSLPAAVLQF